MTIVDREPSPAGVGRQIASVTALRQLALAAAAPAAMRAAIRIGLADEVTTAPVPLDRLAHKLQVDRGALERLLRNLGCYGMFAVTAEGVAHTPTSALLREDHPYSLRYWVLWVTEPWT